MFDYRLDLPETISESELLARIISLTIQTEEVRTSNSFRIGDAAGCYLRVTPDGTGRTWMTEGRLVTRKALDEWAVSLRPSPGGRNMRHYANPVDVARVVLTREHLPSGFRRARDGSRRKIS